MLYILLFGFGVIQLQTQKETKILGKMRFKIPIRFKIIVLVAGALTISLLSYLYVGTNLIVKDKTSYIYEYNLSKTKAVAAELEAKIERVAFEARLLGETFDESNVNNERTLNEYFSSKIGTLKQTGIIFYRPIDKQQFRAVIKLGANTTFAEQVWSILKWTPLKFEPKEYLFSPPVENLLPIGGKVLDRQGKALAYLTFIQLTDKDQILSAVNDSRIDLYDSSGQLLYSKSRLTHKLDENEVHDLVNVLLLTKHPSGVRDWIGRSEEFMVSYQQFASSELFAVGFIPKSVAFNAASTLIKRSLILGISILLLATGLTIVFVRRLTIGLRQMWHATKKVSEGDFSCRVAIGASSNDEVGDLARSFNSMADKIDELMIETAHKARMEKELETAQAIQSRFFPAASFDHRCFKAAGKSIPASECAGDWWHYVLIGKHLVLAIGDVTGHGVSAALVTAAAYGAFSIIVKDKDSSDQVATPKAILLKLIDSLNFAVRQASGGNATMTFFAAVIDLETGRMQYVNAAHRPPICIGGKTKMVE